MTKGLQFLHVGLWGLQFPVCHFQRSKIRSIMVVGSFDFTAPSSDRSRLHAHAKRQLMHV